MPTKMGFLPVPASIAQRNDLTAADKLVCGAIGKLQGYKASVRVKTSTIAKTAGCCEKTVRTSIKRLEAEAVIAIIHGSSPNSIKRIWVHEIVARNVRKAYAEKSRRKTFQMPAPDPQKVR